MSENDNIVKTPQTNPLHDLDQTLDMIPGQQLPAMAPATWQGSLTPGTLILNTYRLVRPLGEGGMGEVFVAKDVKLGRRVAVKTLKLPGGLGAQTRDQLLKLFRRDAASTAQLNHPNIVVIHHFEEHQGTPVMILEHIQGTPLDHWLLENYTMPEPQALRLAQKLANALHYAHQRQVIHRDIKPANLMYTRTKDLKILDFGISLMRQSRDAMVETFERSSHELSEHLGESPRAAGTPAYMAPEQLMGLLQDERVDVWAFGVVLYELLTGERPYATPHELTQDFSLSWPPYPPVTKATQDLLEACLKVKPAQRLDNFETIGHTITQILGGLEPHLSQKRTTNLTPWSNQFVGRSRELEQLDSLLLTQHTRLLTLTGPGGVGKTRLISQWGRRALENKEIEHVFLCDLTEHTSPNGILAALSESLQIPLTQEDPLQQLAWALESKKRILLVLDNCEQTIEPVIELATKLLQKTSLLQLALTSQATTGLPQEHVIRLTPLGVSFGEDDARTLFLTRAKESSPEWGPDDSELEALNPLLLKLDGIPLAIELAAARINMLSIPQILERMSKRFALLRTSQKSKPSRQATLLGAMIWSWQLLTPVAQRTLAQLSVFEGGFTLEEAEDIVDLGEDEHTHFVLDLVESLTNASLIHLDRAKGRFKMLSSVQLFSAQKLKELELTHDTKTRHAAYFAQLGEPKQFISFQKLGNTKLLDAADNLRAMTHFCFHAQDPHLLRQGLLGSCALAALVEYLGPFNQLETLHQAALPHLEAHPDLGNQFLGIAASICNRQGDYDRAINFVVQAHQLATKTGDLVNEAKWKGLIGGIKWNQGQGDEALKIVLEAVDQTKKHNNKDSLAAQLSTVVAIHLTQSKFDQGAKVANEAIELATEVGNIRVLSTAHCNLAIIQNYKGHHALAEEHAQHALQFAQQLQDPFLQSVCLGTLADIARIMDRLDDAETMIGQAISLAQEIGAKRQEGFFFGTYGNLAKTQKKYKDAHYFYTQALEISRQLGAPDHEGGWLANLGDLFREQNKMDQAKVYFHQALEVMKNQQDLAMQIAIQACLGSCEAEQGNQTEALDCLQSLLEPLSSLRLTRKSPISNYVIELADLLNVTLDDELFMADEP